MRTAFPAGPRFLWKWPSIVLAVVVFLILRRRRILPGQHFHLYLIAYGLFRFWHEFMRATPRVAGEISGYQIAALSVAGLGILGLCSAAVMRKAIRTRCRQLPFFRRALLFLSCFGLLVHSLPCAAEEEPDEMTVKLDEIRKEHGLPAIAAAAIRRGKLIVNAASGLRKMGSDEPVTTDDQWHLGSCTKSMTATLAGMLARR